MKKDFRDFYDDDGNPREESTAETTDDESIEASTSKAKNRRETLDEDEINMKLAELDAVKQAVRKQTK